MYGIRNMLQRVTRAGTLPCLPSRATCRFASTTSGDQKPARVNPFADRGSASATPLNMSPKYTRAPEDVPPEEQGQKAQQQDPVHKGDARETGEGSGGPSGSLKKYLYWGVFTGATASFVYFKGAPTTEELVSAPRTRA